MNAHWRELALAILLMAVRDLRQGRDSKGRIMVFAEGADCALYCDVAGLRHEAYVEMMRLEAKQGE